VKYAVFVPADQTICYLIEDLSEADPRRWSMTTKHSEATLWDDKSRARAVVSQHAEDVRGPLAFLETVEDEVEFRGREDTW
jgi:hypothetical protein